MASNLGTVFVELSLDDKVYKQKLSDIQPHAVATAKGVETAWKALGTKSAEVFDAQRRAAENAYTLIKNSATRTSNDIIRAEEAKNAKIKQLNEQQYGHQTTMLEGLKKNWIAASVAIGVAMVAASKAMAYMEEGAKALQIESSFKIMSDAAGVHSEKLIASMKAATKETIDDSDMMQKAIKLMTLGYNPEQIERFSRVVITASQIAGTTAAEAYDGLADAIANRMPKALVRMGAVTKEQMKIVNKAIEEGADSTKLYELAMANLEMKQLMLQGTQDGATIAMQRFHAQIKETKEELGKGLIILVEKLYGVLQAVAAASLAASGGLFTLVSHLPGTDKAKWQGEAKAAFGAGESLAFKSNDNLFGATTKESKASSDALKAAQDRINALMKEMNAIIGKGDASKKAASEQEAATKKILEATRKAAYELEAVGQSQYEKDMARIQSEAEQYRKSGVSKIAVAKWVATETALADGKNTERMFQKWNTEADKAISAMQTEIDAGVRLTEDKIRDRQKYNEFAKEQADLLLSVEDHAIEDLIDKEKRKYDYLEKLEADGVITHKEAEEEKRKATENRIKSEREITTGYINEIIDNTGRMVDAAMTMYDEESSEYKRLAEAKKAVQIAELAMTAAKNAQIIASNLGLVASNTGVAISNAGAAVTGASIGVGPTGFATAAAMIALMASVFAMYGIAAGGGSSASAPAPKTYNQGGDSGPLGAETGTASESMANSLEKVEGALDNIFNVEDVKLTKIYNELKQLNNNIMGLVSSIFRMGGVGGAMGQPLGQINNLDSNRMNWSPDTTPSLLKGFVDASNKFWTFGGNKVLEIFNGITNPLAGGISLLPKLWNSMFGGDIEVSLQKGGIEFGNILVKNVMDGMNVSAKQFALYKIEEDGGWFNSDSTSYKTKYAALDDTVVNLLTKMFDNIGTTLVTVSEGLGTSIQAAENYIFKSAQLDLRNMNAEEMSKAISTYFSDVADQAASDLFGTLIGKYQKVNEALFETAIRLITDKTTVMNVLSATGHGIEEISTSVIKTREVISNEWTKWETDRVKWASSFFGRITTAFGGSYKVPEPDKYVTQTYQEITSNAQAIIELSESLIELAGGLDKLIESAETYYNAFYSEAEKTDMLKNQLMGAFTELDLAFPATRSGFRDIVESLDLTTEAGQKTYVAMLNMSEAADKYYSYVDEIVDSLKSAREDMQLEGLQADIDRSVSSRLAYMRILDQVREGNYANIGNISDILDDYKAQATNTNLYATKQDYQREFYKTYNSLAEMEDILGGTKTIDEQQLDVMKEIASQLGSKLYRTTSESITSTEQAGIAATVSTSVKDAAPSFISIISDTWNDITKTLFNSAAGVVQGPSYQIPADYDPMMHLAHPIVQRVENGGSIYDQNLRAMAEGGDFSGGYRIVGENGPEIEYTGPSQITSNAKSKALLDNTEVVRELKSLREDIKAYGYAIAKNTGKSAKVSDRWDVDGIPSTRTLT